MPIGVKDNKLTARLRCDSTICFGAAILLVLPIDSIAVSGSNER